MVTHVIAIILLTGSAILRVLQALLAVVVTAVNDGWYCQSCKVLEWRQYCVLEFKNEPWTHSTSSESNAFAVSKYKPSPSGAGKQD